MSSFEEWHNSLAQESASQVGDILKTLWDEQEAPVA